MFLFNGKPREPSVITRADRAREAGQWQLAAGLYRIALDRTPNNPPIWLQYGHALKELGNCGNAETAYRIALFYEPNDADAHLQLGHVLKLQGKIAAAKAAYSRALALNGALADALVELRGLGALVDSPKLLMAPSATPAPANQATHWPLVPNQPNRPLSTIARAERARSIGRWDLATRLYRRALDRAPCRGDIWAQYGDALEKTGHLAEAENAYRIALAYDPASADCYLQLGYLLERQGKIEEAEVAYMRNFTLDSGVLEPVTELGRLVRSSGRLQQPSNFKHERPALGDHGATLRVSVDKPRLPALEPVPVRTRLVIEGWVLARDGIDSIDVRVGDRSAGSTQFGLARWDVASEHPDWPDAGHSGFISIISRRELRTGRHPVCIIVRDKRGKTEEIRFGIDVAATDVANAFQKSIGQVEIDIYTRILEKCRFHPTFCLLLFMDCSEENLLKALKTFQSLREQIYTRWHLYLALPGSTDKTSGLQANGDLLVQNQITAHFAELSSQIEILQDEESSFAKIRECFDRQILFGTLAAGDELRSDALLQCAVFTAIHQDADFVYSDELRPDLATGHLEAFLKPQWSPDLLLSTNYIGRLWFASAQLFHRGGIQHNELFRFGDYDLLLRLTEAARAIRHIPELLCRRDHYDNDEGAAVDLKALHRGMARSQIKGEVQRGAAPGIYRLRRTVSPDRLVSIVIPTCAAKGMIKRCVDTLRDVSSYRNFEIVCIENIPPENDGWRTWLQQNADRVLSTNEPFNWSRFNNLAAVEARGEFLLFLNDDVEIIEPNWLDALLEHAQRPEVGVVGPMLLWPDRTIQGAGVFMTNDVGKLRHAFRNSGEADPGYFGLALSQRNVIAVNGACFLTRRMVFDQLRGFNEAHRVVNNETDYCFRASREGLRIIFTPYSRVVHHERTSRNNEGEDYDAAGFRKEWGALFIDGDPYHSPGLSKEVDNFVPEAEPVRVISAGQPLLQEQSIREILLVKLDHIGDCITAFPAIRRLKQAFPRATFRVLAGSWTKPIWSLADVVD